MKIVMFVEVQEGLLEIYCNNVVTNLIFEATRGITSSHSLDSLLFSLATIRDNQMSADI